MADYYKILGIPPEASDREIRAAYRRMAKKYHPDAGEGSSAEKFRDVQDAYELLSNSQKRSGYDHSRASASRSERRSAARTGSQQFYGSSHIDLRDIVHSRREVHAEPIGFRTTSLEDEWRELLDFLLRDL